MSPPPPLPSQAACKERQIGLKQCPHSLTLFALTVSLRLGGCPYLGWDGTPICTTMAPHYGTYQYFPWQLPSFSESGQGHCKAGLVIDCPHSNERDFHGHNSWNCHWRIRRTSKHPDFWFHSPLLGFLLFIPPSLSSPRIFFVSFYSHSATLSKLFWGSLT